MYFIGGYCQNNVVKGGVGGWVGGEVGCRGLRKKIKMGDGHIAEVGAYKEGGGGLSIYVWFQKPSTHYGDIKTGLLGKGNSTGLHSIMTIFCRIKLVMI